jgi:hypothetical protein
MAFHVCTDNIPVVQHIVSGMGYYSFSYAYWLGDVSETMA